MVRQESAITSRVKIPFRELDFGSAGIIYRLQTRAGQAHKAVDEASVHQNIGKIVPFRTA